MSHSITSSQPIEILVGSTSGNTEDLAAQIDTFLKEKGYTTRVHDYPEYKDVPFNHTLLFCIATHGAGEYADSIYDFMDDLKHLAPDLSNTTVAIIAIGDTSYDTYCQAGHDASTLLSTLGAKQLKPLLTIDMKIEKTPEDLAIQWLQDIF